ncbi:MAG: Imidazole glycerol phosphate synthase subunit HisH [Gammaproteobacteria bacterium]|nr:Imidazole glycerol phosphate synthase subunit HisH [Gammaproteobacteria bacterium]
MNRIAVIDLGTGNLRSVARALETAGRGDCEVRVSDAAGDVSRAERIVFPGQSAIGSVMGRLRSNPALLDTLVESMGAKPFLGICIGLQALYARSSEDGGVEGLGVLSGEVRHFLEAGGGTSGSFNDPDSGRKLKIPHMGWNNVCQTHEHPLWQGIEQCAWFYFVHSYCAFPDAAGEVYGVTSYGLEFAAAAGNRNAFAIQFHPEKSQQNGLKLLGNFIHWDGTL